MCTCLCFFVHLYHKFVWRFEIAQPLTDLLWSDGWKTPFSQDVLDDVDKLNVALCSSFAILWCQHSHWFIRRWFWSEYWGCVETNQGWLFASYWVLQRRLTPAEMKYAVYDRELVGPRDTCLHFRYQLLVIRFMVRTDHSSLRCLR